jgi:inward rectifier potassium channel
LSWTLYHAIDETSPLYRLDQEELAASDAVLVLNLGGIDDSSAQRLSARKVYSQEAIRWHHRYVDITSDSPEGRLVLDYTKFDEVTPEPASADE